MSSSSLESRLRKLEVLVGVDSYNSGNVIEKEDGINSRLEQLERHFSTNILAPSSNSTGSTSTSLGTNPFAIWNEIDKMLEELSAGTALTHQNKGGIAAPMIYRRQEVLASADKMKHDMDCISSILNTILIDNCKMTANVVTEDQVANAPVILNSIISQELEERLEKLVVHSKDIQSRASIASNKLDKMVYHYHHLIQALSQKLVDADETIRQFELEVMQK